MRVATQEDFAWIDAMQKAESDKLGFLPEAAIRKRIERGEVVVAAAKGLGGLGAQGLREEGNGCGSATSSQSSHSDPEPLSPSAPAPLGYCMACDRYMKQDHVGMIYQLNVAKGWRRSLVGAALVQAVFDRAAYGTRLFGLWCKQTLAANDFWESLGFSAIAFRTGSRNENKKGSEPEVHIYWQKHIRPEDAEAVRRGDMLELGSGGFWYPYETQGGLMAESRLVLPIPPGMGWRDVLPTVLPGSPERKEAVKRVEAAGEAKVETAAEALKAKRVAAKEAKRRAAEEAAKPRMIHGIPAHLVPNAVCGYPEFGPTAAQKAAQAADEAAKEAQAEKARLKEEKRAAKAAVKAERRKSDPELVAKSRALRDVWREQVVREPGLLLESGNGKYEVVRMVEGEVSGVALPSGSAPQASPQRRRLLDMGGTVEVEVEVEEAKEWGRAA